MRDFCVHLTLFVSLFGMTESFSFAKSYPSMVHSGSSAVLAIDKWQRYHIEPLSPSTEAVSIRIQKKNDILTEFIILPKRVVSMRVPLYSDALGRVYMR